VRKVRISVLLLSFVGCGFCQSTIRPSSAIPPLKSDVLSTWTTDQGLPQNFVTSLAQTRDGFLWVGTLNGLLRFDGVNFRSFTNVGPPEMQDDITGLFPDETGGLWISTNTGLFQYQQGGFTHLSLEGETRYEITLIAPGRNGGLWIYGEGKLAHTNGLRLVVKPLTFSVSPKSIAETSDGRLWIAGGDSVHVLQDGGEVNAEYRLPNVQMLYCDPFGELYAGDGHHLFRFNRKRFQRVENPGVTNFVSIMVDRNHSLWMASGGLHGLSRKSDNLIETLTDSDGLASNDVRTLLEDRDGDIWIGTIAGLQRLHVGIFSTYTMPTAGTGGRSQPDSVFEQKNGGAIWEGTVENGIARFQRGDWRLFGRAEGLPPGQVRGFFENGDMPGVAVSDYGIFAWTGHRFRKLPSIPHGYISIPVRMRDGTVWFTVLHRGLFVMSGGRVRKMATADGLDGDDVSNLQLDPEGSLWVGTNKALYRWDGKRFVEIVRTESAVLDVAWLPGALAIATFHGLLFHADDGKARLLTQENGLSGNMVLDVVADDEGNLWVATTTMIARFRKQQWQDYLAGHDATMQPAFFSQTDGLKSRNVLPLNHVTATRASDGRIWFATSHGLSVVDARTAPEAPARASMDTVIVDEHQQPAMSLTVPPGRHRITFSYTGLTDVAPEQTRFRYHLQGWDRDWIEAGTSREVSYVGLPPGTYNFQVMAVNREGLGDSHPAVLRFTLQPFFWQTNWFRALAVLLIAGILIEVTRRRTRIRAERLNMRFQERVAERERIASQIHDTVIQDLTGATLKLELIGFQVIENPQHAQGSVETLTTQMREMVTRSRNMVSNLHSAAMAQYSLIEILRHAEAEFRVAECPAFELSSQGEPTPIHPLVRDEVYRICREALANAFRHSNATLITVRVHFLENAVHVQVGDNGRGISEEVRLQGRPGHFGLRGMATHAQRIGATLTITSAPEAGTTVMLQVPIRKIAWSYWWRKRA
jgi:signal transduction histidine kinase/ligand-binding sensor domain-containing protein